MRKGFKKISQLGGPLTLEFFFIRWFDLLTCFVDDHIVCSSQGIRNIYSRYFWAKKKCDLVHYAFPLDGFLAADKVAFRRKVRREYSISEESFVFGMVAYMYKSHFKEFKEVGIKGHEVLLRSAVDLFVKYPRAHLLIVGQDIDGGTQYLEELKALTLALGLGDRVTFTGFRSDVAAVLSAIDVAVVPSLTENCGGAVEPLLMGIPVVASNVGGLPEVVMQNRTGWLASPGDVSSLRKALEVAINTPQTKLKYMGNQGSALIKDLFDPDANALKLLAIYGA